MKNKAIFLDRDGVINDDTGYVGRIEDFNFLPDILEPLRELQSGGYLLIIVTGQSGIGRGYFTEEEYNKLIEYMLNEFNKKDITISKVYYCPHTPDENCNCRKPKPGMLKKAIEEFDIDITQSWLIGDKLSDMDAGENIGCKTVLLDSRYVKDHIGKKYKNLKEATSFILNYTNL